MKMKFKKQCSILLMFFVLFTTIPGVNFTVSSSQMLENDQRNQSLKVIVQFNDDYKEIKNMLRKEVQNKNVISYKQLESNHTYLMEVTQTEYDDMLNDPNIKSVEVDRAFSVLENDTPLNNLTGNSNDGSESKPTSKPLGWNLLSTGVHKLHEKGITGKGIKVAILDTGINTNSNDIDLAGGVSFVEGCSEYSDDNGHGTKMASVLASNLNSIGLVGFAPDVDLYSVKVLDKDGVGRYSAVLNGVEWAIDNNIDIITMSFGSDEYSESIHQAVKKAEENGILIVASAGNTGNASLYYPAAFPSVIAVGATDENDKIATFSNYGNGLDILAPGVNIDTYDLQGNSFVAEGTSIAAQEVAGVAALLKSVDPKLSANQLKDLLYGKKTKDQEHSKPMLLNALIAFDKLSTGQFSDINSEEFLMKNEIQNENVGSGLLSVQTIQTASSRPVARIDSPKVGKYVRGWVYPEIYVQDNNNNKLTCAYYIDYSRTPVDTKEVTGTKTFAKIKYDKGFDTSQLSDGKHRIRVEVSVDKSIQTIEYIYFNVDNTPPVIDDVKIVPDGEDFLIYVDAYDPSGLDTNPYEASIMYYYFEDRLDSDYWVSSKWSATSPFRFDTIEKFNRVENVKISVKDAVGNINNKFVWLYIPPKRPNIEVTNFGYFDFLIEGFDTTLWHEINVNEDYYVDVNGLLSEDVSSYRYWDGEAYVNGLEPGTTYYVKARGKQDAGDEDSFSAFSDEIEVRTLNTPPLGNLSVYLDQVEPEQITFSWYGVSYATSYIINVNGVDIDSNYIGNKYSLKTTPNSSYSIKVKAKNAYGVTGYSDSITAVSKDLTNVRARAIDNHLDIVWDEVPGATDYTIEVNGSSINYSVNANSIVEVDKLTGKRMYHYNYMCNGNYNRNYQIRMSARVNGRSTGKGKSFSIYSLPSPLSATDIQATNISINSLDLNWNSSPNPNTVQYRVEVFEINNKVTGSVPYKTTDWSYSKSARITGLKENTEYAFRVKAKNSQNMEANSGANLDKIARTLISKPESPINMISTSKDSSITIKWDPVRNANSYRITRDGVTIASVDKTTYTDQGILPDAPLTANTEYSYQVFAINEAGEGAPSLVMKKRTLPKSPAKPENITTESTKTSVSLAWDEIQNVTGYEVEFDGKIANASLNNHFTMNGLEPGALYSYRVRARNEGGKSEWSELKTIKTAMGTPSVPLNLILIPNENKIETKWDASSNATSYTLELNGNELATTTETSYDISNLTSASIYDVRVKAVNSYEQSDWSTKSTVATLSEVSGSTKIISTSSKETAVRLEWQTIPEAKGYTVQLDDKVISENLTTSSMNLENLLSGHAYAVKIGTIYNDDKIVYSNPTIITTLPTAVNDLSYQAKPIGALVKWSDVKGASGYEIEINGETEDLGNTNQFFYEEDKSNMISSFKIRAYNKGGSGAWSNPLEIQPFNQDTAIISDIRVEASSSNALVSWENILTEDGKNIYGYEYKINGQEPKFCTQPLVNIENLLENTSYLFEVRSIYDEGRTIVSDWSEPINFNTVPKQPQTLINITFKTSNDAIYLTWDNVDGATGYELMIDNSIVPVGMVTHYIDGGLVSLSEHTYQIRVIRNGVRGIWSEAKTVFTQEGMPGVPLNIIGTSTRNSVTFKWDPVEGASSYLVKIGESEKIISVSVPEVTIGGLADATLVSVSVCAVKSDIPSPYSGTVSSSTGIENPTGVTYAVENGDIVLKWNKVNLATQYEIEVEGNIVGTTTDLSYVLHKIEKGLAVKVRIRAKNDSKAKSAWTDVLRVQSAPLELPVQVDENEIFDISLKGNAVTDFTNYTFTIEYDKQSLELVDLYSLSESIDLSVGNIKGTDLIVLSTEPGKIVFKLKTTIQYGKEWSGLISALKFKALKSGQTQIKYSVQ